MNGEPEVQAAKAGPPRPTPTRKPLFYGWAMLAVAILALFACYPGQTVGIAAFNPSICESLSLSQSRLAGAYLVATLVAGCAAFLVGAVSDRHGLRSTITVVVVLLGVSCVGMAQVSGLVSLFFAFLVLRVLGHGALPLLVDNTLAMWFHRRLGLVSAVKNVAAAAAVAAVPSLNLLLIHSFGWRWAYALLGIAVLVVVPPLLILVYRERPEDVGQRLDGITESAASPITDGLSSTTGPCSPSFELSLAAASRTRAYWIMIAQYFATGMVWAGTVFNILPLFESHGLTDQQAATTLAVFAISMAAMQPFAGLLSDRLPLNLLLSISSAAVTLAMGILLKMDTVGMAYTFAVSFGLGCGLAGVAGSTLWPRYFGRTHLGKIRGGAQAALVVGSSIGPFLVGASFDYLGSFDVSLLVFLGANALLTLATLFATRPIP